MLHLKSLTAAQALRIAESEERLRVATEAADLFAWEMDFSVGRLIWAPNSARVIGCKPEDLPFEPSQGDFFAKPEDRPAMVARFEAAMKDGSAEFSFSFRDNGDDPERQFWQVNGRFIRDETTHEVIRAIGATQNVTKQKRADDALRVLAERVATAEDAAGAIIYDWDVVADKMWRSASLTRILGWQPDEIGNKGGDWAALRHPDDANRPDISRYSEHLRQDDRYVLEYRTQHRDGHYVWLLDSGRVLRDASGSVIRVAGAAIDISQRKKIEASVSRLAKMVDLSFEPIFVWHPQKGILEWNRGAEQLYGFTRKEAMGRGPDALLQTQRSLSTPDLIALLRSGASWTGDVEQQSKEGRTIFVQSRHQIIDNDGEWVVLESSHDITQRREAEAFNARMAAIALASHDALFGLSLDGVIETWNSAAARLFGYAEAEAIGKSVSILADPSQNALQNDLIREAGSGHVVGPYEARRLRKDGTTVFLSVALAPIKGLDGTIVGISAAMHDISERREWEAQQRLMTRELAHRSKNSFAVLQGILRSTLRTAPDPKSFADAFSGRLHSLAAAQDVLSSTNWKGAELGALIRLQLASYVSDEDTRVDISGPHVNLPPEYAAPFGLIFNELATNAVKYGALSAEAGNIQVYWRVERLPESKMTIFLTWRERGGPCPDPQVKSSFGTTLIEKSLPGAKVQSVFEPEGLTCKIEITVKMGPRVRMAPRPRKKK